MKARSRVEAEGQKDLQGLRKDYAGHNTIAL